MIGQTDRHTHTYTAGLPVSYKLGSRWDDVITWSDFKSTPSAREPPAALLSIPCDAARKNVARCAAARRDTAWRPISARDCHAAGCGGTTRRAAARCTTLRRLVIRHSDTTRPCYTARHDAARRKADPAATLPNATPPAMLPCCDAIRRDALTS